MQRGRAKKQIRVMVILIAICLFLLSGRVYASAGYDTSQRGSITIQLSDLGTSRSGTIFTLYQVGVPVAGQNLTFNLTEEFKSSGVDLNDLTQAEKQQEAARKCAEMIPAENLREAAADEEGTVVFADLEQGVYLIKQTEESEYGAVAPFLIFLPYTNTEGSGWIYDIKAEAKAEKLYSALEVLKVDENDTPITGAKLALYDTDEKVLDSWTSSTEPYIIEKTLLRGSTYTIKEVNAPAGYLLAEAVTFTPDWKQDTIKIVMTDKKRNTDYSVKIKKYVMYNDEYRSVNLSFYAALFWDPACTQRASEVAELKLEKSFYGTAVFPELTAGTFYLAETDEEGNPLDVSSADAIFTNEISNQEIVLTPAQSTAESTIINHFRIPDNYLLEDDAKIQINKNVTANGSRRKVTDTFYFTLFGDEEMTTIMKITSVKLNNEASAGITLSDMPYGTYYIAESDASGNPVGTGFAYTVSSSEDYVTVSDSHKKAEVSIVNDLKDQTKQTETDTTARKENGGSSKTTMAKTGSGAKTGDNTGVIRYLLLLAGTGIILVGILKHIKGKRAGRKM